jgi:hypothetical protein
MNPPEAIPPVARVEVATVVPPVAKEPPVARPPAGTTEFDVALPPVEK